MIFLSKSWLAMKKLKFREETKSQGRRFKKGNKKDIIDLGNIF